MCVCLSIISLESIVVLSKGAITLDITLSVAMSMVVQFGIVATIRLVL